MAKEPPTQLDYQENSRKMHPQHKLIADLLDAQIAAETAKSPQDKTKIEALQRSAISRIYFECYHRCRRWASKSHWYTITGGGKDHGNLLEALNDENKHRVSNPLRKLQSLRTKCDYGDPMADLGENYKEAKKYRQRVDENLPAGH